MGLFTNLKNGLSKTRDSIVSGFNNIFNSFLSIDDDFYDELEETMIMGDIGVSATEAIIDDLKEKVRENRKGINSYLTVVCHPESQAFSFLSFR